MKKRQIGTILMMLAIILAIVETKYFGNNTFPETSREWIADLICLALFFIGVRLRKSNK